MRPTPLVILTALGIVALAGCGDEDDPRLRLATGGPEGTYFALGQDLAEFVARDVEDLRVEVLRSAGSIDNMERLAAGEADLAFVQSDTLGADGVRLIAPVYEEVLHVFIRSEIRDEVRKLSDLRGRSICVGAKDSGTANVVARLLDHLGLDDASTPRRHLSWSYAVAALAADECDAACALVASPFPAGRELLESQHAVLLSLGDFAEAGGELDGICAANPNLSRTMIPVAAYGPAPTAPVGTVAVWALLVARRGVDDESVKAVTRVLFDNQAELAERQPVLARLTDPRTLPTLRFPLHDGAAAYYHRDEPVFFVRYADAISLGLTIILLIGSSFITARAWLARRKKNRIDVYYLETDHISEGAETADREGLEDRLTRLHELRRKAFRELVKERLLADESFTIFQDFLQSEYEAIRERLGEK